MQDVFEILDRVKNNHNQIETMLSEKKQKPKDDIEYVFDDPSVSLHISLSEPKANPKEAKETKKKIQKKKRKRGIKIIL